MPRNQLADLAVDVVSLAVNRLAKTMAQFARFAHGQTSLVANSLQSLVSSVYVGGTVIKKSACSHSAVRTHD
ncbi:hypothetical protein [Coleofasciculus sp. G3-WIS-01]|uniref:hypothetical protein n=1 Tax=Coleofasciculus sp. G3-WIS-01 TaxID=3069528 RepID=UPI004062E21B